MVNLLTAQLSHTYGVLDPLVIERRDTKFLAASLSQARNIVLLPQGGYVDRGGSRRLYKARRQFTAISLTTPQIDAPNGGSKANLLDDDSTTLFTTTAVAGDPFVLFEVDLVSETSVAAVDLTAFKAGTASRDDCVAVQWLDGSTWRDLCAPFHIRTAAARNRRFAGEPGTSIETTALRAVIIGGAGIGTVSVGGLAVWQEGTARSDAVVRNVNRDAATRYQLVLTHTNIDIFRDGVWQAAVATPYGSAKVREVKIEPGYDTVLLFLQEVKTRKLVRAGSDREWNIDAAPFDNLPNVDYGEVYSNGVNERQRLIFYDFAAGNAYELIVDGQKTNTISYSTTPATNISRIKDAIEALAGIDPGISVTSPGTDVYWIEFSGGDNAAKDWPEITAIAITPSTFISVSTLSKGRPAGEAIMSSLRGWPAVGRFAQERLCMGGITERAGSFLASVTGDPFNMEVDLAGATAALIYDLAGDDNAIREIFVGRTILLFTPAGVWHMASPKLSAEAAPELARSDAPGIEPHCPVLSLSNQLWYVQRGGRALLSMQYSELERNFIADNASVLSAFLVAKPQDMALRRAAQGNDADVLMYCNEDGTLVTVTIMRSQEISGFAPHVTDGKFRSVCADNTETVYVIVERDCADGPRMILERLEPDAWGDSALEWQFEVPSARLTALEDYEGKTLHVWGDGAWIGGFTVTGGVIDLPQACSAARAGLWTAPQAVDTPFHPEEDNRRPLARRKRVYGTDISVADTEAISVTVNDGAEYAVPLAAPYTGTITLEGFPGFTGEAKLTISQTRPGRLKVRSVKKRIAA